MSSSSTFLFDKYPYPYFSEFKVTEFVPQLNENNYDDWKHFMEKFIKHQGLFSFIDSSVEAPLPTVYDRRRRMVENEEYRYWKRSDVLVRGWILATLPKNILQHVIPYTTAQVVWTQLKAKFNPFRDLQLGKEKEKSLNYYRSLHIAAIKGDWESASKFIQEDPDVVKAPITLCLETALHVAISSVQTDHFVENLLQKMSPQDLALPDIDGQTALHVAADVKNIEAAKLLIQKNSNLPNVSMGYGLPLHFAAARGYRNIVSYLWDVTQLDLEDYSGALLLRYLAGSGLYDFALTLLQRYPKLACMEKHSPLMKMVEKRSSFRSGTPLNFWQNLIYKIVPMKSENIADCQSRRRGDIENPVGGFISRSTYVPQLKDIREKKLMHHQALEFVKLLCNEVAKSNFSEATRIFAPVLMKATSFGIHEIIEEILVSYPSAIFLTNPEEQNIFQYAIVCRRKNVFNLIYQRERIRRMFLSRRDRLGNNGLHLAGCLRPQQQLNLRVSAAGAVLQMQQELQWFKAVEKISLPGDREARNIDGMTPAEIFTDTHKELVKEGERWMKETTNSFTIVVALIGTVVFAAAITVPGGNNNDSGHPIFSKQIAFVIFAISDALALFSSIVFVVMFLSILTCSYAEQDFLYSLPNRLIIGLVTLFFSILFTMIAFGAILYLVFGDNKTWILIPIVVLASLPLFFFVFLQLPLFVVMVKSTYGRGIFGKQRDRKLL